VRLSAVTSRSASALVPLTLETTRVATDNAHPYVAWTLPQDIYQSRYAVKIT